MTISEAVSLILEAGATKAAGDVSVLDMGEPIGIVDLARDLITLRGEDPDAVEFVFTGLRPGERLHETLFYGTERAEPTEHPGILRAASVEPAIDERELGELVDRLEAAALDRDDQAVRSILRQHRYLSATSAVGDASEAMA